MRMFLIAADVAMGLILGVFVYAVAARMWVTLQQPIVAVAMCAASVLVVLFRRPNGSLSRRGGGPQSG
jgi:uncharacterized membrane protein